MEGNFEVYKIPVDPALENLKKNTAPQLYRYRGGTQTKNYWRNWRAE